jgi:hypothetical protein
MWWQFNNWIQTRFDLNHSIQVYCWVLYFSYIEHQFRRITELVSRILDKWWIFYEYFKFELHLNDFWNWKRIKLPLCAMGWKCSRRLGPCIEWGLPRPRQNSGLGLARTAGGLVWLGPKATDRPGTVPCESVAKHGADVCWRVGAYVRWRSGMAGNEPPSANRRAWPHRKVHGGGVHPPSNLAWPTSQQNKAVTRKAEAHRRTKAFRWRAAVWRPAMALRRSCTTVVRLGSRRTKERSSRGCRWPSSPEGEDLAAARHDARWLRWTGGDARWCTSSAEIRGLLGSSAQGKMAGEVSCCKKGKQRRWWWLTGQEAGALNRGMWFGRFEWLGLIEPTGGGRVHARSTIAAGKANGQAWRAQ